MNIDNILEKFESFILMKNLTAENETWKIKRGKNVHTNGMIINHFIKLVEKQMKTVRWPGGFFSSFYDHVEIFFNKDFVLIKLRFEPKQKNVYKNLHKYFLENKDIVKNISTNEFVARFENHEEFDKFFENYIIGESICCLY